MEIDRLSSPILLNETQLESIKDIVQGRLNLFVNAFEGKENILYCSNILGALIDIKDNPNINDKINTWAEYKNNNTSDLKSFDPLLEALDNIAAFILKDDKNQFVKQMSEPKFHRYSKEDMEPVVRDYLSNFTTNQVRSALGNLKQDLKKIQLEELLSEIKNKEDSIEKMLREISSKEENINNIYLKISNNQKEETTQFNSVDNKLAPSNSPRFKPLKENPQESAVRK